MIRRTPTSLATGIALALAGCTSVAPPARLDSFSLGRSSAGEACVAARNWNDPGAPDAFARAYSITCSTAAANRPLGTVRAVAENEVALKAIDAQFDCAAPTEVTIGGKTGTARRCLDKVTGLESIRLDRVQGGTRYVAAATPALLPQVEEALAVVAGTRAASADVTRTLAATVDPAVLPARAGALPVRADIAAAGEPLNIGGALAQGIDLNHKGLHVEASRVLNDALSRLGPTAAPVARAELLLEAGLADSNILFPEAARAHFAAADAVFAESADARTPLLLRKRDTYLALDALNRSSYGEALALLDRVPTPLVASAAPLTDLETLRALNQPRATGAAALAVPDASRLAQLVLDAQAQYARSVALLAQGDRAGAGSAIERAGAIYRPLASERLDQAQLFWLGARIARQRGRILAREGRFGDALARFDDAVEYQRRGSLANGGTGAEPAIAEAELERAAVFARTGANPDAVRSAFGQALDAVIASGSTSLGRAIGMEDYLDLLVEEAGKTPRADTYDRYFRAIQASGEPAVARQLTQLRTVVTADPAVAQAVRERADLERQITRLRYAIANRDTAPEGAPAGDLDKARASAEQRLIAVDAQLAANARYRQVDDNPATLAELRAALRPGEAFLKLTALDRRIYGLVVTADRTFIYHVANSAASRKVVDTIATELRASIDGGLGEGRLVPFDEARAYTLFRLIAGPAAQVLTGARAIAVDPAGPLQRLPIGVLVTRYDPAAVRADAFDFSQTAFLARTASISTALSPRSFLVARALPASAAPRAFIGFGQHQPPALVNAVAAARMVDVGYGCQVAYGRLASLSRTLKPISSRELNLVSGAIGAGGAPEVTGAAFTDVAVETRGDLDQFKVLHFATHGLEEGVWGCSKSPPALVTSFANGDSDGLLSFSEIAGLRLDANLVVLSACDTGAGVRDEALARASGQEEAGSTLEGLVRAFLTANARAVLATYWQVSAEQESEAFLRTFYSGARTGSMGDALQQAQRSLIEQPAYSHPFYWAPFFLVGDSSKMALSGRPTQMAKR